MGRSRRGRLAVAAAAVVGVGGIGVLAASTDAPEPQARAGFERLESAAEARREADRGPRVGPVKPSPSRRVGSARPTRTPPLRDLRSVAPGTSHREAEREQIPHRLEARGTDGSEGIQRTPPIGRLPAPIVNFAGGSNAENPPPPLTPPDTDGDVGPNHYMQWINIMFSVYDKTGTRLIDPPLPGNALFPGKPVCGTSNDGDPIVVYDQYAGRWVASQFALPNFPLGPFYQCIAVSRTSDPTGDWCGYEFQVHATKMNDYPKFGVWPSQNSYFMTVNQFNEDFLDWAGAGIYAFERDKMLACETARLVYKDLEPVDSNLGGMLPADPDGPRAPPAGAPSPILQFDDNAWGAWPDRLQVWNATTTWGPTPTLTMTKQGNLNTAAFDSNLCGYAPCVPQPGTPEKLDALSDRLLWRLAYRSFAPDHEAMVVNHTVDVGGDRAGIRWYELRRTTGNWGIHQQGTYAPSDGLSRWMGSAAMDGDGNIAIGFSFGSSSVFPGIAYVGRLAGDPPNTLPRGETALVAGNGSQTSSFGRWGDYSALNVDPLDDCTFWYTNEYLQVTDVAPWLTRIGAFRMATGSPTCFVAPSPPPPPPPPPPPASPAVVRCRVPKVIGLTLGTAKARIRSRKCAVGPIRRAASRRALRGRVIGQSPRAGAVRARNFRVSLVLGR